MIFRFAAIQATLASAAVMVAAATTIAESSVIVSAGDERDVVVAASTSFVPRKLEAMRDEPSSSDPVIGRTALRSLESATMTTKRLRNGDVPGPHRAEGGDFDEAAELGLLNQRDANHRGERGLAVGDCESNPTVSADAVFHGLVTACLGLEGVPERDASAVPDGDGSCPYPGVPLGCWDTSEVTNMDEAFLYAADFDGDIDSWDTSSVTSMARTFKGASSFNSPIDSWDVTNVESFASTFENAKAFDQNVDDWDVRSATTFERMFYGADEFFQCISSFHVESGYNLDPDAVDVTDMFKDSGCRFPETLQEGPWCLRRNNACYSISNAPTDTPYLFPTQTPNPDASAAPTVAESEAPTLPPCVNDEEVCGVLSLLLGNDRGRRCNRDPTRVAACSAGICRSGESNPCRCVDNNLPFTRKLQGRGVITCAEVAAFPDRKRDRQCAKSPVLRNCPATCDETCRR